MPAKAYLSLVFHNHQPVGNFPSVFQEAFEKSYEPLVALLERHPRVRAALHFTGPLRDWLYAHHPLFYPRVRALVERGQVEVLGGAYYEPILVMLSDEDKIGQMQLLSAAVQQDTGAAPVGMWLAERIWEPGLARPIARAGLRYAVVDDTHFNYVGFKDDDLYGYYVTEEQGEPLALFPSSKHLRYLFPWRSVDEVLRFLRATADRPRGANPPPLVLMGDDGEKFGMWLGTFKRCWTDGYMDALFTALEAAGDWLETITPADYMARHPSLGRAYLPTASYMEMTEWALPAERFYELVDLRKGIERDIERERPRNAPHAEYLERIQRYLRGGFWRHFLVKYPEANHMQKRGMFTSRRVHALKPGDKKARALQAVWASQCNCAYWHGVFGGVYLFHIRAANYASILEAEALLLDNKVRADLLDFDLDGRDELVVGAAPFSLIFDAARGGALIEWDDVPARYNLLNVMTRRREGYHTTLENAARANNVITPRSDRWNAPDDPYNPPARARELGLEKRLFYDWHRRGAFIDHFLHHDTTLDDVESAVYGEEGDFVVEPYHVDIKDSGKKRAVLTLSRDGRVWAAGVHQPVRVEKRFTVTSGERELLADYTISSLSDSPLTLRFAVEMAYGLDGGDTEQCYLQLAQEHGKHGNLGAKRVHADTHAYALGTYLRGFELACELAKACDLWRFPLELVTMGDSGFERIHQGAVFLHVWSLKLKPGGAWKLRMRFVVREILRDGAYGEPKINT